jgi:hypothetical protein
MTTHIDIQIANIQKSKSIQLYRIVTAMLVVWSVVVLVQWLWWFEQQDYVATFLTYVGGVIGMIVFFRRNLLVAYPVSTTMMLGYVSYYFLLPPLATFLEGKPLTNNLYHPALVLFHATVSLLSLIGAFTIYSRWRIMQGLRWFVSRKIYQPFGLFRTPSNQHLLVMGSAGLIAMGVQIFVVGMYQNGALGIINKFMQGLYPLAYLPYVVLVRKVIDPTGRFDRKWLPVLFGYTILIAFVSLGRNSRVAILVGIASIILVYFYGLAVGFYRADKSSVRKIALAAFALIVLSGPIIDLATSMMVVRGTRTKISALELVSETITTFRDKEALNQYRLYQAENISGWDERYLDNVFAARLSNLKYADNSIDLALSMGRFTKEYIREIEEQKILAIFPRPIINALGLLVDKAQVEAASSGDFMYYAVTGSPYALGGFRTGSIFGNGYALFGWWYPLVFAMLVTLIFPFADSLTTKIAVPRVNQSGSEWIPCLSPVAIVGFFTWFFYLTSAATGAESISSLVNYLLRGWIQTLFVYALLFWVTYIPLKMISRRYV